MVITIRKKAPRRWVALAVLGIAAFHQTSRAGIVKPAHVVIVIEEDRAANAIGDPAMPYFNQLASTGLVYKNSRSIGRPGQLDYLALYSGSTQGVTDDAPTHHFTTPNLAQSLNSVPGLRFAGYMESLPRDGSQVQYARDLATDPGGHPDIYTRAYNPMAQFTNVGPRKIPLDVNKTFRSFPTNYASLPSVSFVIPNNFHNTHGSNEAPYITVSSDYSTLRKNADTWLNNKLSGYVKWAKTHNSLLIVTGDEEDLKHHPENGVTTIVNGDRRLFVPGVNSRGINAYNLLRTIENMYGLAPLGKSAGAAAFDTNAAGQLIPTAKTTVKTPVVSKVAAQRLAAAAARSSHAVTPMANVQAAHPKVPATKSVPKASSVRTSAPPQKPAAPARSATARSLRK